MRTQWDVIFRQLGQENLVSLVKGDMGYKDLENLAKFTPVSGVVRNLLRTHKLNGTRRLLRKALQRRGMSV